MYLFNFSYLIFLEKTKSYNDPETCLTNFKDIENVYKDKYSPAVISSDIKTRKRLGKILEEKFCMISPTKISFDIDINWKTKKFNKYRS